MLKTRQKFFATCRIEMCVNKSHFLYITPPVWERHQNRPLQRQDYRMLCIMKMRETHSLVLQSPRCIYDIWEKVALREQLYWEK